VNATGAIAIQSATGADSGHVEARDTMEHMDRARRRLQAEREQTLRRLASLTDDYGGVVAASRDTNADDEHDPEGATIAFERSQIAALVRQARLHLDEIDAAVTRLDSGTYGVCERCGRAVGEDRLEARPVARTCIECAAGRTGPPRPG
jgi:DnaK suppressor protein